MSGFSRGPELPNIVQYLEWRVPSFTIAAGSTSSPYFVPEIKRVRLNPLYSNLSPGANNNILQYDGLAFAGTVTTDTSDPVAVFPYFSLDGGGSYSAGGQVDSIAGHTQNYTTADVFIGTNFGYIQTNTPVTNNEVLVKMAFTDATSPTTDIFTITNVRIIMQMWVIR